MKFLKINIYVLTMLFFSSMLIQSCTTENIDETEFNPLIVDCSELEEGDSCFTTDGLSGYVSYLDGDGCDCIAWPCQDLNGDAGSDCTTDAGNPGSIVILTDGSCECTDEFTYDCEVYQANIGDQCPTSNNTVGSLDENCDCIENDVDCPNLGLNIGEMCLLGEDVYGTVNNNCECE